MCNFYSLPQNISFNIFFLSTQTVHLFQINLDYSNQTLVKTKIVFSTIFSSNVLELKKCNIPHIFITSLFKILLIAFSDYCCAFNFLLKSQCTYLWSKPLLSGINQERLGTDLIFLKTSFFIIIILCIIKIGYTFLRISFLFFVFIFNRSLIL